MKKQQFNRENCQNKCRKVYKNTVANTIIVLNGIHAFEYTVTTMKVKSNSMKSTTFRQRQEAEKAFKLLVNSYKNVVFSF